MPQVKNIIVLGELDYVIATSINENSYQAYEYTKDLLPISRNASGSTNINCLHVVNNELEKILNKIEVSSTNKDTTFYIAVPSKLFKTIQKGTYKNWILNDGKATTGYAYTNKEMNEWRRLSELYSKLFLNVNFRDINYYSMNAPKYDVKSMQHIKTVVYKIKRFIEKKKEEERSNFLENL